jgi:hypothetical protein
MSLGLYGLSFMFVDAEFQFYLLLYWLYSLTLYHLKCHASQIRNLLLEPGMCNHATLRHVTDLIAVDNLI